MAEPVDPAILEFIRATRERYTRQAITDRLRAAGKRPDDIERAWQQADTDPPQSRIPGDWRPGYIAWIVLVGVGAVGAFLVWRDEPYGAGGIAPVVYVIAATMAFAVGKGVSILVDHDQRLWAAIVLGLAVAGLAIVSISSSPGDALGIGALVAALAFGVVALALAFTDPALAGLAGGTIPILAWLVVTGVCYSPLIGR